MNKICGVLLFAIPLCIGVFTKWMVSEILIVLTCAMATFAAIQELHLPREYMIAAGCNRVTYTISRMQKQ